MVETMVNGVSMVQSMINAVVETGKWWFNGGEYTVNGVSMVKLYGWWCSNGETIVNGDSMVETVWWWCFNGTLYG